MTHFCLLADANAYHASDPDLFQDQQLRQYWLKLFEDHFATVLESARGAYGRNFGRQIEQARKQFLSSLEPLRQGSAVTDGRLGVIELCRLREKALRDNALHDPFRHIKARENRSAIELYPGVIEDLQSLPTQQRWEHLVRGVFAGNIFDLGSPATLGYAQQKVDFHQVLDQVKPRPWLIDDFDRLAEALPTSGAAPAPWAKAVVFIDNAGSDLVLGVMPLARQLAAHGVHVVLAANELPSLNDITADETVAVLEQLVVEDSELASYVEGGLFEVVSTGNDLPLLDLSGVSDELNAAAADADLVVLEGMGRTVESNLQTQFKVDAVQLCLLKDPTVAARVNGQVYDCVCKFDPVAK
jgi:type II pantothenate kinase